MKLKTVEVEGKTYAEIKDGHPVYVNDSGVENAYDVVAAEKRIKDLNAESAAFRKGKSEIYQQFKPFEGMDAEEVKKALETVAGLDANELVKAGDKDAAIQAALKPIQEELKQAKEEADNLKGTLHKEMIGGSFARSPFVNEKLAIPADMVEASFGRHFKLEDGKVVAYDNNNQVIYGHQGQPATFDEAIEVLVSGYAHKDHILKGSTSGGGGSNGSNGDGGNNPKQMTREAFDALAPAEKMAKAKEDGFKVVDA